MATKKPLPNPGTWLFEEGDVVQHLKTRGIYKVVAHALQEDGLKPVYVYREVDGRSPFHWTRPKAEMEDGRFVPAATVRQAARRTGTVRPPDRISKAGKNPEWVKAGLRLKRDRRKANIVQWRLAELIGHSRSHISHMEQGLVDPNHKDMKAAFKRCAERF